MRLTAAFVLCLLTSGQSARILGLFAFPAKSHFNSFSTLLEELAKRGHEMTVVSGFPRNPPIANYTDIAVEDYMSESEDEQLNWFQQREISTVQLFSIFSHMSVENCKKFFNYPQIQELMRSDKEYDLIIIEALISDCSHGFIHKFQVPFIQISSNTIASWMGDGVGNPNFFSYVPDIMLSYTHEMSFMERFHNAFFQTYVLTYMAWNTIPRTEEVMRKYFNDPTMPSINEIRSKASFLLLNSHVSLNDPRPLTPNTAEVGGMHIREPRKLPQDLQKYLDDAPHGVIYFSLGSIVRAAVMPTHIRQAFLDGFSRVKQKVLWKWEESSMAGKPNNIRTEKWLPQNDILAHPNVKVFMTHGGLLSTEEATYHAMPLIAIPVFADQTQNARRSQKAGTAVVLDLHNITADSVQWAINEVLTNPSYAENAKKRSRIFRDQPEKPLDRAVFWVEYVIRHNGAPHMKSAALKLNFFQYYCLGVIAVVLLSSLAILAITVLTCKAACRRICLRKSQPVSKSKKDK